MRPSKLSFPFVVALAASAILVAPAAHAQGPQAPTLPVLLDLRKVPVGTYSEYSVTMGQMGAMKQKAALVERNGTAIVLEMTMEGGPMAQTGRMVVQIHGDADPAKVSKPSKVLMQFGTGDPMEMPTQANAGGEFKPVDPKTLGPVETIKVAAGTFKVRKHTMKTANGTMEAWLSEDVPPFGLVKAVNTPAPGTQGPGVVTAELVGKGVGAKRQVTKPGKPFDPAALMQMMQGGGAAPPAAPAKAAAPAKPAKDSKKK